MIEKFSEEKRRILDRLYNLENDLGKLEEKFELDLSNVRAKINTTIGNIKKEKFSIAFFGAFSDGKSTVLSAITQRLDIKIAPEPTTAKIATYEFGDYFIVDTPGLFSEHLMHDELTKKYISEASVIIYVVDAVNPIKNSHYPTVKWILEDLNKADSTIFVVNKMDEVADLEDGKDYKRNCDIKKKVVINTLKNIVDIKFTPKVLCMAAAPFGKDLKYWFNNLKNYKKLSRIDVIHKELNHFIDSAKNNLIIRAGFSVIKDSVNEVITQLEELEKITEEQIEVLDSQIEEISNRLRISEKDINRNYVNIKKEIILLREDILQSLESAEDAKSLRNLINSKIGNDGGILEEKINLIINKYTERLYEEQHKILKEIENTLEIHNEFQIKSIEYFAKSGARLGEKILAKSTKALRDSILKTRDMLKLPIKFKPWGAKNLAIKFKAFGKFLKGLPILTELLNIILTIYNEEKLKEEKENISKEIIELFKIFIETFTLNEYKKTYFSNVAEMSEISSELSKSKDDYWEILKKLRESIRELKKLVNGVSINIRLV